MNAPARRVLMIAYHFPPLAGSSGIQRTLRFVQELGALGWQPLVLSAHTRAYERISDDLLHDVPPGTVVRRAQAFDAARHLSLRGRYLDVTARPDRWVSWRFDGVRQGLRMIHEFRPQAIWSTYPIATAHLIGAALQRRSGLPWVADFRDPMAQDGYPEDPRVWRSYQDIERQAMAQARHAVFTTPSALRTYRDRYPDARAALSLIANGYDEASFRSLDNAKGLDRPLTPGVVTLLHSGIVYPSERDPTALFVALGRLLRAGAIGADRLRLRFRAAVHDALLRQLAEEHRVGELVEILPPLPYREALQEMVRADGLLVMQAANCNAQIPAKIYEYLRARRPIVCLADPDGDTESILRAAGVNDCARLASSDEIAALLPAWADRVRAGMAHLPDADAVAAASRQGRARQLAALLDTALVS